MKNKLLTDDEISPLASPSIISRTNCVNKITFRGRSQEVHESVRRSGQGMTTSLSPHLSDSLRLRPSFP